VAHTASPEATPQTFGARQLRPALLAEHRRRPIGLQPAEAVLLAGLLRLLLGLLLRLLGSLLRLLGLLPRLGGPAGALSLDLTGSGCCLGYA